MCDRGEEQTEAPSSIGDRKCEQCQAGMADDDTNWMTPCAACVQGYSSIAAATVCYALACTAGGVHSSSTLCIGKTGDACTFVCDAGFTAAGSHMCTANGTFAGGRCDANRCVRGLEIANSRTVCMGSTGQLCQCECNAGFSAFAVLPAVPKVPTDDMVTQTLDNSGSSSSWEASQSQADREVEGEEETLLREQASEDAQRRAKAAAILGKDAGGTAGVPGQTTDDGEEEEELTFEEYLEVAQEAAFEEGGDGAGKSAFFEPFFY